MTDTSYDLLILGSGPGGYVAAAPFKAIIQSPLGLAS
jgi:pyruvate/2-oxoglutarate dehydrogenase complex dihydrolipoamide dehydrogenase (E3) component